MFAHGARDPRWAEPFQAVLARLRELEPGVAAELAYLEFTPPTLAQAGQALAALGCRCVDVVPLFLGAGGHVRRDLPRLVEQLAADHPEVRWHLQGAIGERPPVIEALAREALNAAGERST